MAFSVSSSTHIFGKGAEEFDLVGMRDMAEVGVQASAVEELAPMVPIACPFVVGRIHDPIGDGFIRSSEKTSNASLVAGRKSRQEASCVRGKSELNFERKEKSLRA
jgi:hypothetical protein